MQICQLNKFAWRWWQNPEQDIIFFLLKKFMWFTDIIVRSNIWSGDMDTGKGMVGIIWAECDAIGLLEISAVPQSIAIYDLVYKVPRDVSTLSDFNYFFLSNQ